VVVDRGSEAADSSLGWETSEELPSEKGRGAAAASSQVLVVCFLLQSEKEAAEVGDVSTCLRECIMEQKSQTKNRLQPLT